MNGPGPLLLQGLPFSEVSKKSLPERPVIITYERAAQSFGFKATTYRKSADGGQEVYVEATDAFYPLCRDGQHAFIVFNEAERLVITMEGHVSTFD